CDGGNHEIVWSDGLSLCFQFGADSTIFVGGTIVEGQTQKDGKKCREQGEVCRLLGLERPVIEFPNDNRAEAQFPRWPRLNMVDDMLISLAKIFNARIGVEQKQRLHSSSRTSQGPCGGRSNSPTHLPAVFSKNPGGQALAGGTDFSPSAGSTSTIK